MDALYDDLDNYKDQIERMYQGQAPSHQILQGSIMSGVKRQVRDERILNKQLQDQIKLLKTSMKATKLHEL